MTRYFRHSCGLVEKSESGDTVYDIPEYWPVVSTNPEDYFVTGSGPAEEITKEEYEKAKVMEALK